MLDLAELNTMYRLSDRFHEFVGQRALETMQGDDERIVSTSILNQLRAELASYNKPWARLMEQDILNILAMQPGWIPSYIQK